MHILKAPVRICVEASHKSVLSNELLLYLQPSPKKRLHSNDVIYAGGDAGMRAAYTSMHDPCEVTESLSNRKILKVLQRSVARPPPGSHWRKLHAAMQSRGNGKLIALFSKGFPCNQALCNTRGHSSLGIGQDQLAWTLQHPVWKG
eukprot:1014051-Pleurochrysis_carterae.AAC.1